MFAAIIVCFIIITPAVFMLTFAGFRFNAVKDLIPDLSLYNYKDPLTSHLQVGSVVMILIVIIIFLGIIGYEISENTTKADVIKFFEMTGKILIFLLILGIILAIVVGIFVGLGYATMAILDIIESQPVPQINDITIKFDENVIISGF